DQGDVPRRRRASASPLPVRVTPARRIISPEKSDQVLGRAAVAAARSARGPGAGRLSSCARVLAEPAFRAVRAEDPEPAEGRAWPDARTPLPGCPSSLTTPAGKPLA